jgi:serine/threonine-protein kinase
MRLWTPDLWARLSPLLDRALDLDPHDRDALLASVRAEDGELGSALERLLAEHERVLSTRFLESPPPVDGATTSLAGQTIGAYTLERPLGVGGMGTVWLAHRSDGRFEGRVAMKFVNFAVLDQAGRERFRREGTVLARLSHPNIARLHDAGVTPGGQPYLVLEYIEGVRVDHYAAAHRLPLDTRLRLFLQVADAVAHAHANLVVHRDLKPSNVLVGADGRPKLLDFGIATLVEGGRPDGSAAATVTTAALTPEYAAPEQIGGTAVTTATDVYALGVLLYQLLIGRHPTAGTDATHAAMLRALAEREPPRLSDAAGRLPDDADTARLLAERDTSRERLRRACRGDLDTILAKALKKPPAERYQTVTAFAEDIRRHLRHEPVAARPDSVWYRTRKFAARHRLEFAAAAAAVLALVAGTGIAVRQAGVSARARDRALEQLRRAEVTNDFSSFLLSEATPSDKPVTNTALLAKGEEVIERQFAGDPLLLVHLRLVLADRHYENAQYDLWQTDLTRAYEQSRTLDDVRLRSLAGCRLAAAMSENGDYAKAFALVGQALADLQGEEDALAEQSACYLAESISANMQGDAARAIRAGETSLRLERDRHGPAGSDVEALAALANAYGTADRFDASDRAYAELMKGLAAKGRAETRDAATLLTNWAVALDAGGQQKRAAAPVRKADALTRQLDVEHGPSPAHLRTVASILSAIGDQQTALAAADEGVLKARTGGSVLGLFWALGISTRVYSESGRFDESEAQVKELRAIVDAHADLPARERAAADRFAALAAVRHGRPAAAIAFARRSLDQLEAAKRPVRDKLPVMLALAWAYNGDGQFDMAATMAQRAKEIALARLGDFPHSQQLGLACLELGVAEAGRGRLDGGRALLREAVANLRDSLGDLAPDTKRAVAQLAALGG